MLDGISTSLALDVLLLLLPLFHGLLLGQLAVMPGSLRRRLEFSPGHGLLPHLILLLLALLHPLVQGYAIVGVVVLPAGTLRSAPLPDRSMSEISEQTSKHSKRCSELLTAWKTHSWPAFRCTCRNMMSMAYGPTSFTTLRVNSCHASFAKLSTCATRKLFHLLSFTKMIYDGLQCHHRLEIAKQLPSPALCSSSLGLQTSISSQGSRTPTSPSGTTSHSSPLSRAQHAARRPPAVPRGRFGSPDLPTTAPSGARRSDSALRPCSVSRGSRRQPVRDPLDSSPFIGSFRRCFKRVYSLISSRTACRLDITRLTLCQASATLSRVLFPYSGPRSSLARASQT